MRIFSKVNTFAVAAIITLVGCQSFVSPQEVQRKGPITPDGYTVVMMPDTQRYSRYNPEIYYSQTKWIAENYQTENIVFTAHLGDVVDTPHMEYQWENARKAMGYLEENPETPYSILAGNHDVLAYTDRSVNVNSNLDTQRGDDELYIKHFSVERQKANFDTLKGADETGYNTYHIFKGGDREFLLLALDWRPSRQSFAWAQEVLDKHSDLPTILTTHQLVDAGYIENAAIFTGQGRQFWNRLIRDNNQIFMAVNGHHIGEGIKIEKNRQREDVILVLVNYQNDFMGGNGLMQLVTFIEDENKISFRSFSPWVDAMPGWKRSRWDEVERWNFEIDFDFDARIGNL